MGNKQYKKNYWSETFYTDKRQQVEESANLGQERNNDLGQSEKFQDKENGKY